MTYIWNRANKVPEELLPERLTSSFRMWLKEQYGKYKIANSKKQKKIVQIINKQTENYQDAVGQYKKEKC